jgi:hypothetical protein
MKGNIMTKSFGHCSYGLRFKTMVLKHAEQGNTVELGYNVIKGT